MKPTIAIGLFLFCIDIAFAESTPHGPTVQMSYHDETDIRNPIETFMYFIPLTSPVRVQLEKSDYNSQKAWVTGYELKSKKEKFRLRCEFTIEGDGYFVNEFNHQDIIAYNTRDFDRPTAITNLDYMKFEGDGRGAIEVTGYHDGGIPFIADLTIDFSVDDMQSPVVIGLYSIDPVDGFYDYETRHNFVKARIRALSFSKVGIGETPTMGIKLATFGNASSPDGFTSSLKAIFANFFVTPIDVNPTGNSALLDFAEALYLKKEFFVFPLTPNIDVNND